MTYPDHCEYCGNHHGPPGDWSCRRCGAPLTRYQMTDDREVIEITRVQDNRRVYIPKTGTVTRR